MNSRLSVQSFDKTTLLFSDWLDENIQDERKTKNIRRNGSTVYLKEQKTGFSMNVKIENVDQGLSMNISPTSSNSKTKCLINMQQAS